MSFRAFKFGIFAVQDAFEPGSIRGSSTELVLVSATEMLIRAVAGKFFAQAYGAEVEVEACLLCFWAASAQPRKNSSLLMPPVARS
jgi:hypothetical protein